MTYVRGLICDWTFVVAVPVFLFGAVVAFVVIGDALHPTVLRFGASALVCMIAQFIYEEAADN